MKISIGNTNNSYTKIKTFYKEELKLENIFNADKGQVLKIPSLEAEKQHLVYIGLGEKEKVSLNDLRNIGAKAFNCAKEFSNNISFEIPKCCDIAVADVVRCIVEGINLSNFSYYGYKTDSVKNDDIEVVLENVDISYQDVVEKTLVLTNAMNNAKKLTLEPCNKLYPQKMAQYILNLSKEYGFEVEILNDKDIQEKGLNSLYAVGKGSVNKPMLVVLRYKPLHDKETFGLVGKGITCDTGGYCLKDRNSLPYIKGDMAGAANMIATICAIAKNKCKTNIVAVIPLAENKISSNSYIPGDIIKSLSGKTIEVLDTDCEGRMVLADALTYAVRYEKVNKIIDMATLTGLAGMTFGSLYTPIFCNDEKLYNDFMHISSITNEDFWRMPLDDRYKGYLSSSVADISNKAGAGTITAAMFLKEFVEDTPWIHLDIAATAAQYPCVNDYANNMPSAIGVRTIYYMLCNGDDING